MSGDLIGEGYITALIGSIQLGCGGAISSLGKGCGENGVFPFITRHDGFSTLTLALALY